MYRVAFSEFIIPTVAPARQTNESIKHEIKLINFHFNINFRILNFPLRCAGCLFNPIGNENIIRETAKSLRIIMKEI